MKLKAARGRRDASDIDDLLELCDVRSIGHSQEIFDRYYPEETMKPRAVAQIDEFLGKPSHTGSATPLWGKPILLDWSRPKEDEAPPSVRSLGR
jgi:hypothetical protein